MTAVAGHERTFVRFLTSTGATLFILSPSLAAGLCLLNGNLPLQPALKISYLILFLMSVNFAGAIMLEPYRRYLSKLSLPAILGMAAVVLLFTALATLKPLFTHISFGWLTPFVVAGEGLIYTAIFREKNIPLKCLLSLDSIALMFLYALSAADKFTLPF